MKQQTRRLAIVISGALSVASALIVVACSTDNGSTPLPGSVGTDSGQHNDTGASSSGSSGNPGTDGSSSGGNDAGDQADCSDVPALHKTTAGFFCSFYKDGGGEDAGSASNCSDIETCCNPGKTGSVFGASFCAATPAKNNGADTACSAQALAKSGTAWQATGGSTWECAAKDNCGAGQTCCIYTDDTDKAAGDHVNVGPASGTGAPPKSCNALMGYKYAGTKCAASCTAPDEIELCSETANTCSGGTTCTPFTVFDFRDLGYCK